MLFKKKSRFFFKKHFYGMKYFHKLKEYQIIICEIVLNEVHFKFQVTTNKHLKDSLR